MLKDRIIEDINRFEQRRITRVGLQLLVGLLAATLLFFPMMALAEYFFYLSPVVKTVALFGYIAVVIATLAYFVVYPWWKLKKTHEIGEYEVLSKKISGEISGVDDSLINYLQLLALSLRESGNTLVNYSLRQKQQTIAQLNLPGRITIQIPARQWYRFIPLGLAGLILLALFFENIREGSQRFVHFNQQYQPPAPFEIVVGTLPGQIMANEPLLLKATVAGNALPENLWVKLGERSLKMNKDAHNSYSLSLENLEPGHIQLSLFSGPIASKTQDIEVLAPGQINQLKIKITPPAYTGKPVSWSENEGNLLIPAGSMVSWQIAAAHVKELTWKMGEKPAMPFQPISEDRFAFETKIATPGEYQIQAKNQLDRPDQKLNFGIELLEDQFPRIAVETLQDSISMSKQYFIGKIADDYGFSKLSVLLNDPKTGQNLLEVPVSISRSQKTQEFAYVPEGKAAQILQNQGALLSFKVWDNDAVAGPKSAISQVFEVKNATRENLSQSLDRLDKKNEQKLEELAKKSENLEKNSKKLMDNLKGKKELNWQEKKDLQNYVEKQKDLLKQIEDLKKEADKSLQNKQENQLQSEQLLEKQEQVNKMLEEILDPKIKELLKELEKLLEQQNPNKDQLQDMLEKMQDKNEFLENELDRAMEMLKQLKVEEKLEKAINDLEKLAQEQQKEGDKNQKAGDKQSESQKQEAQEKQKEMNEMFKQVQEDLKEMQKLNQELKDKNDIDTGQDEQKEIEKDQQESGEQMKQGKMQKAGSQQQRAAQNMKKMAQKMKESQMQMQGGADQEDIGDLRSIIENLLHVSFDQEEVYKEIARVNQLDPRYLALAQKQIKIGDDAQVIKDSLIALAKRAPQIQSFVMKEVYAMDNAIEEAVKYVKARRPDIATSKGQLAMTSINNLTVMLKDALQQMQDQQQQQQSGSKSCKKPGKKGKPKPGSMSQMQKQLNEQIQQLKNGQKPGQSMTKELAQLAQKQAAMRRALAELEKSMQKGKEKSGGLGDVKAMMEKTERELLTKKLSPETIMRQQQILTRLLESEKAMMEREQDQKREAEKPNSKERTTLPPQLQDLLKRNQSQNEQLLQNLPKLTELYQEAFDKYMETLQLSAP